MLRGDDFRIQSLSFSIHLEAVPDPKDPIMKRMKRNEVGDDWKEPESAYMIMKPERKTALTNCALASRVRLIMIFSLSLTIDQIDFPSGPAGRSDWGDQIFLRWPLALRGGRRSVRATFSRPKAELRRTRQTIAEDPQDTLALPQSR